MDEEIHERVRDFIKAIPRGRVATYGDIADLAKAPSPRLVGRILNEDGHDLPWQRVLRPTARAPPPTRHPTAAPARGGVPNLDGKVNLREYRWEDARKEKDEVPGLW